jgi:hypothetical protein
MKLRLNLFDEDVAFCFGVHRATVSRNFDHVLDILYVKTKHLIHWPDRDVLYATMPTFFKRPSNLLARARTWSNSKHHSTVKFLIGITPQGNVQEDECLIEIVWYIGWCYLYIYIYIV